MKLKRLALPKAPPVKKSTKGNRKGAVQAPPPAADAVISQHAPGLGFDFNPADPNMLVIISAFPHLTVPSSSRYLVCTEEGLIHKCSCSYNEQFLETYKGHTVCHPFPLALSGVLCVD